MFTAEYLHCRLIQKVLLNMVSVVIFGLDPGKGYMHEKSHGLWDIANSLSTHK